MKKIILALFFLAAFSFSKANYILIPMDASQPDHLKAYGIAFQSLKAENTVQWLLNYRGGAFLLPDNDANEALIKNTDVTIERLTDKSTQDIVTTVLTGSNNMNLVTMSRMPKIAVYAAPYAKQYDDAVTLALTYAGIDFTTIYDREMLTQDLSQYDWIHLDHEDFTGQYNKWQTLYAAAPWYKNEIAVSEATAKSLGYAKVSQMKLAVAKKFKSFVENGGQMFAMCSGADAMDIALAADGIDIVPMADGDPADASANSKLSTAPKKNGPSSTYTKTPAGNVDKLISFSSWARCSSVCCCTSTLDAMRNRKCSVARITPIFTATTKSTNTVRKNVTTRITTSARGARCTSLITCLTSLIFHATTNKMAANTANGTLVASGARKRIISTKVSE